MSEPFRDAAQAALARVEALDDENEELRRRIYTLQAERDRATSAPRTAAEVQEMQRRRHAVAQAQIERLEQENRKLRSRLDQAWMKSVWGEPWYVWRFVLPIVFGLIWLLAYAFK
jgi:hypothetical protein